jgi:mannose-6-phosphate isomerase-like protein (cupin superfamily)
MKVVNLAEKFSLFNDHWKPRIVGELNGHEVKLAKLLGEFVWHKHFDEDELFMVIKGALTILLRAETILLNEGEFYIVPKGVEHKPVAIEEAHVLMVEPSSTLNTGSAGGDMTVEAPEHI